MNHAATLHEFSLQLAEPLTTAKGVATHRTGILLCLADEEGRRGWGEASPLPGWPGPDLAEVTKALGEWTRGGPKPVRGAAAAAIDGAQLDLASRRRGVSLAEHLSRDFRDSVSVNALLDQIDPEQLAEAAQTAVSRGFSTLKIKVGTSPHDLDRVAQVRTVAPDAQIRLDANQAWAFDDAVEFCRKAERFEIEFIEEPVAGGGEVLAELGTKIGIRLAADESLEGIEFDDLAVLRVDVLIIKPSTIGRHERLVELAAKRPVVVTSFIDSAIGVATALQVAAALPGPQLAAGLATSKRFMSDVASLPEVRGGRLALPEGPGIGADPTAFLRDVASSNLS
ncbi:MAG: o-succinylbenzoate synthase [Acidimicrobiales bacterium]